MKRYGLLALGAFAVLAAASAWLGGVNQDEGWYLYAAQLVEEGRMPYRDFFYTQGPLLPLVYSSFTKVWKSFGLLGARAFTCALGFAGILLAALLARVCAPPRRRAAAGMCAFVLLACNLYHVYYTTIPKTYALGALFVTAGFLAAAIALRSRDRFSRAVFFTLAGFALAMAAGARISLGLLLASTGFTLLFAYSRYGCSFLWFGIGGAIGLAAVYGPFLADSQAFAGLCAAQKYHAARSGFSVTMFVGSVSRLVRWYLPVFALLAVAVARLRIAAKAAASAPAPAAAPDAAAPSADAAAATADEDAWESERVSMTATILAAGFLTVFAVQMLAPVPYDDYNTPVMPLAAVLATMLAFRPCAGEDAAKVPRTPLLAAMAMSFACSFGSPLLEKWTTNGQDRFWTIVKDKCEMAQLGEAAAKIESLDPGGTELFTQDVYLAIESRRRIPKGLEMGPFSQLSDDEWREMLSHADAPVAALSGYTFAIRPPACDERPLDEQLEFWSLLRKRYSLADRIEAFGQNATTLLILKRTAKAAAKAPAQAVAPAGDGGAAKAPAPAASDQADRPPAAAAPAQERTGEEDRDVDDGSGPEHRHGERDGRDEPDERQPDAEGA